MITIYECPVDQPRQHAHVAFMRNFSIVFACLSIGCAGRIETEGGDDSFQEPISVGGLGGAPSDIPHVPDNEHLGGMGGTCSETVTAIEVPEDHCIRIAGHFDVGAGMYTDECQSLSCEDLPATNIKLWRGWGEAVRYVHHLPECGSFDYEITPGKCD